MSDVDRVRAHIEEELRAAATYRALADQVEGMPRDRLLELAADEERHARDWATQLHAHDTPDLGARRLSVRGRALRGLTRRGGLEWAVPFIERSHLAEATRYAADPNASEELVADEQRHLDIVAALAPRWRTRASGTIRAAVFGISDGIVSNLALVMGVVGAGTARATVLVTGFAGLLAGAMSMAAGEFVSVASQQELLRADGETEEAIAAVGSARQAALTSLGMFSLGAFIPILPFLLSTGLVAALAAFFLCALVLAVIGGTLSLFSDRPLSAGIGRQVGLGLGAALATLVVGRLLGVAIS